MTKHHLSLVIALVVCAVVLAGGWFLGVQPQLAAASSNQAQQSTIDATNDKNRAELTRLAAAFAGLDATKAELAQLRASVPSTTDSESFVRQIDANAAAAGVQVTNVTIGDATPYAPATEPTAETTASAAPSAAATSSTDEDVPSAQPATDPAVTDANFSLVPVTVAVQGSYDQALAFTKAMQSGSRLFLVSGIAAASEEEDDAPPMESQSWSLSGSVYVFTDTSSTASANG
jgi:Tfp pilus assembly protein PilO